MAKSAADEFADSVGIVNEPIYIDDRVDTSNVLSSATVESRGAADAFAAVVGIENKPVTFAEEENASEMGEATGERASSQDNVLTAQKQEPQAVVAAVQAVLKDVDTERVLSVTKMAENTPTVTYLAAHSGLHEVLVSEKELKEKGPEMVEQE